MDFKVGDYVYHASYRSYAEKRVPCPICAGTLQVRLILGDGSELELECDYCTKGGNRDGTVAERETKAAANLMLITSVLLEETSDGIKRRYMSDSFILEADDVFATQQEASARAEDKAAKRQHELDTRIELIKHNTAKSFSWNAGYYLECAKRERKQAEHHERMARICKERVPKEG